MTRLKTISGCIAIFFAGIAIPGTGAVQAQGKYPDRAIRLIVPFPPGGQTDIVGRQLGNRITPLVGQQVVVDNRTGASGTIGSGECARSKPDGYTLLLATSSTHAINPIAKASTIAYDPVKDFTPIAVVGTGPIALSVHPSVPAKTLKQLVADAASHPGKYHYGSSGIASINHLAGELLKARAGNISMLHVPYKGAGASLADLVGGQIPVVFSTLSSQLPLHRQGRLRTLAVLKEERSQGAPDLPTTAEAGVPGAVAYTFNIVLGPAGMPRDVMDYLTATMVKAMGDRVLLDTLIKAGVDPVSDSTPEKATAMIKAELVKWTPLIESLGLKN
jgi:tripartite-type tricarboxylate transporter receptor subunit TctC